MIDKERKRLPGSLRILCEIAPEYGVTAEQCLDDTGLVVFDLYDKDAAVTLGQELAAIENFCRQAPQQAGLGIEIGRRYRPQVFGIWGYAILSSPTLGAALRTAIEFANLSFIIATTKLHDDLNPPLLTFDPAGLASDIKVFILQRHLTVLSNFMSALLPNLSLSRFVFETTINEIAEAEVIEQQLGFKVRIGCPRDAVVLSEGFLTLPLPQHDPVVMKNCLKQCRDLLRNDDDTDQSWATKVREAALMELGNDPTIVSVAAKLGITERTLRRRLADENTSFRDIMVEARLAIGYELLSTARLDVSTVAYRTGYSEPSSFVRAFSQRYGYSPGRLKFGDVPTQNTDA